MNELSLSDPIFDVIHSYKMAMRRSLKAKELGLNRMHVKCLSFIHSSNDCTANDIVNHFKRDKAQVARLIKEMIEKGWLTKSQNPNDKRSQILFLTEQGESLAMLILDTQSILQHKMLRGLTEQEIKVFRSVAFKIADNLKER